MAKDQPDFEISVPVTVFEDEGIDPETEAPEMPILAEEELEEPEDILTLPPEIQAEINEMEKTPSSRSGELRALKRTGTINIRGTSESEARFLVDTIRTKLSEGQSDVQIAEELSLSTVKYNSLKRLMYSWEIEDLQKKTPEEHYVDFRIKQDQTLRNLDKMAQSFEETKNYNALIGAIRLKTEVMATVWKTGREIGIIKGAPDWERQVAGELVSQLETKAIRTKVVSEVRKLYDSISKFGDKDILEVPKTPGGASVPGHKRIKRTKH